MNREELLKNLEEINEDIEALHKLDILYLSEYSTMGSMAKQQHEDQIQAAERKKKNILEKLDIYQSPSQSPNIESIVIQKNFGKGDNIGGDKILNDKKSTKSTKDYILTIITGVVTLVIAGFLLYLFGIKQ